jgi:hypothetical protein
MLSGWAILTAETKEEVIVSNLVILSSYDGSEAAEMFGAAFSHASTAVTYADLNDPKYVPEADSIHVSFVESGDDLFNPLSVIEFRNLQLIAETAGTIFWTTMGNLLADTSPHAAAVIGFCRALQSEYPQLHFITIKVDHTDSERCASQTLDVLGTFSPKAGCQDTEFIIREGIGHVSRIFDDQALETLYTTEAGKPLVEKPVDSDRSVRLAIEKIGVLDTVYFVSHDLNTVPKDGEVEIKIKFMSINMRTLRLLTIFKYLFYRLKENYRIKPKIFRVYSSIKIILIIIYNLLIIRIKYY